MWEPIVQLCALDSVLAFWQTLKNFKFMTAILSHLGGVGRQDLQTYNNHIQHSFISDSCIRRLTQSKVGK